MSRKNTILLILTFFCLIKLGCMRNVYYPRFNGPDAIVFDGPTNFYDTHDLEDAEDDDYYDLLDIRSVRNCPIGFKKIGDLCFPSD